MEATLKLNLQKCSKHVKSCIGRERLSVRSALNPLSKELQGTSNLNLTRAHGDTAWQRAQHSPWGRQPHTPRSKSLSWAQACTHLQVKPSLASITPPTRPCRSTRCASLTPGFAGSSSVGWGAWAAASRAQGIPCTAPRN